MREIWLLGTPQVESTNGNVPRFRSQRTIALLAYLVAERRTITRDRLAALFWLDDPPPKARGKLRRELHNLAQILPGCWEIDRVKVRFRPSAETTVDLDKIRQYIKTEDWRAAADLLRGEFLEGITIDDNLELETWLLGEQERWRQRSTVILNNLVDDLTQKRDLQEALLYGHRLLQLSPWDESAHYRIMQLLAQSGQPQAALKQFESYQRYVVKYLDVSPSARMLDLVQQIKFEINAPVNNLPASVTPFIGRKKEITEMKTLLRDNDCRLLTLVGPGGIGKTRLALEVAWQQHRTGDLATYFVPLQGVQSVNGLARAIADAIGFQFSGQLDLWEQLIGYLHRLNMLLLIDNFEHLLAHALLLSQILETAPGLQLLVTSRERLRLHGETTFTVQGLDYAAGKQSRQSNSMRLFIQAAQRFLPAYQPQGQDLLYIWKICHLVDGMPLALELAASWMNVLSPEQILGEMEKSLDILSSNTRDLPARHMSIEAVFNQSWDMLTLEEQETMQKLSVFAGDFDLDAARHIAEATPLLLQGLVDKSFVSHNQSNRYQLHELLRQYAAHKLGANQVQQQRIVKRHCTYYANLLHRFELESKRKLNSIVGNLLSTQAEIRNIQAAWLNASEQYLARELSHFTYFLSLYYEFQGLIREGKVAFEQALQQFANNGSQVSSLAKMRLLSHFGWMCQDLKEEKLARQSLEEALLLTIDLDTDHNTDVSMTLFFLGWVAHVQGQTVKGVNLLKRSLELSQAADYELGMVLSRLALSEVEFDNGNYSSALAYLALIPADVGPFHTQLKLGLLGISHSALGNYADATQYILQMIELQRSFPNIFGFLLTITGIAALYGYQGYHQRAVELLAVHLNHPQSGSFPLHRTENLLNEFRPKLAEAIFQQIMDKAEQRELDYSFLGCDFGVNDQMITDLSVLLDQAPVANNDLRIDAARQRKTTLLTLTQPPHNPQLD